MRCAVVTASNAVTGKRYASFVKVKSIAFKDAPWGRAAPNSIPLTS